MKKTILTIAAIATLVACKPTGAKTNEQHYFPSYCFAALAHQSNGRIDTVLPLSVIDTKFDSLTTPVYLQYPNYFVTDAYPDTVFVGERFMYTDSSGSGQVRLEVLKFNTATPLTIDTAPYIVDDKGKQWVIVHSK